LSQEQPRADIDLHPIAFQGEFRMNDPDITQWIRRVADGDSVAAVRIFEHYRPRLEQLAARRLAGNRRVADEEDIVVVALNSFFRAARDERFEKLKDRDDLWQVLAMLTARKAINHVHRQRSLKRGGGQVVGEFVFEKGGVSGNGIDQAQDVADSPEMATEMMEELDAMLEALGDETLRTIAVGKLDEVSNSELAEQLGVGLRTIERKLQLIREIWKERAKP
jgi:RNA polymerase sigma factor (sigma-70 family)